ncbi:MAG: DNA adenine methylase [Bacteroidia bacterium]
MKAKPFLKWAGGKSQLLEQLDKYYPKELQKGKIKQYVEPFLGGGAVFFEISQRFQIEKAYLSDVNPDLVLAYRIVQQKPQELIKLLRNYQKQYDETPQEMRNDLFTSIRKQYNLQKKSINYQEINEENVLRTALLIFLNKTCFNGLFRLNSKGEFNVPYGKYPTTMICDEINVWAVSKKLEKAEIHHADYASCFDKIDEDSFVYFDPPYKPISESASFTTYTGAVFSDKEQLELAQFFKKIDKEKGAKLMLSNSDVRQANPENQFFDEIYKEYSIFRVSANRAINCKGTKRGKIKEILITNYAYEPQSLELCFKKTGSSKVITER